MIKKFIIFFAPFLFLLWLIPSLITGDYLLFAGVVGTSVVFTALIVWWAWFVLER